MSHYLLKYVGQVILAGRTNGCAIGTVLRPSSVVCLYGIYCDKTVRPRAKVTIESL